MESGPAPIVLRLVLVAAAGASLAGCVEKRMFIRSDPPGALVWLDDELLDAQTPLEVPYEWDGVRRVALDAPGHKRLATTAELETRWFDWFPLDFAAEFLWPGTIVSEQTFDYELEPYADGLTAEQKAALPAAGEALLRRAEAHRAGGSDGPAAGSVPGSAAAPAKQPEPGKGVPLPKPDEPPPPPPPK